MAADAVSRRLQRRPDEHVEIGECHADHAWAWCYTCNSGCCACPDSECGCCEDARAAGDAPGQDDQD